jgi:hypothetical protein
MARIYVFGDRECTAHDMIACGHSCRKSPILAHFSADSERRPRVE